MEPKASLLHGGNVEETFSIQFTVETERVQVQQSPPRNIALPLPLVADFSVEHFKSVSQVFRDLYIISRQMRERVRERVNLRGVWGSEMYNGSLSSSRGGSYQIK